MENVLKWPNNPEWGALRESEIETPDGKYRMAQVDCGTLKMPSGRLVCCDPFSGLEETGNAYVQVPPGEYRVVVTLAEEADASYPSASEAYASLVIAEDGEEVLRRFLNPTENGHVESGDLAEGGYYGFSVDAGTACFVDGDALEEGMPPEDDWDELFDSESPDCWFSLMDTPEHIRDGIANVILPESGDKNNLVLFHSGFGDGEYPVIGGYDESGALVAVHIDFMVVAGPDMGPDPEDGAAGAAQKRPWWKFW